MSIDQQQESEHRYATVNLPRPSDENWPHRVDGERVMYDDGRRPFPKVRHHVTSLTM